MDYKASICGQSNSMELSSSDSQMHCDTKCCSSWS